MNIISKIDLIKEYGIAKMPFDFYFKCEDLEYLIQQNGNTYFKAKYGKLMEKFVGVIASYGSLNRESKIQLS